MPLLWWILNKRICWFIFVFVWDLFFRFFLVRRVRRAKIVSISSWEEKSTAAFSFYHDWLGGIWPIRLVKIGVVEFLLVNYRKRVTTTWLLLFILILILFSSNCWKTANHLLKLFINWFLLFLIRIQLKWHHKSGLSFFICRFNFQFWNFRSFLNLILLL